MYLVYSNSITEGRKERNDKILGLLDYEIPEEKYMETLERLSVMS